MTDRSPPSRAPSFEWQRWIADNLLRGAPREEVEGALVSEGASALEARDAVDAVLGSPLFAAAVPFVRASRRARLLARLQRELAHGSPEPTRIPRVAFPGVDAFRERYLATGTPAIFTDLVPRWPGFGRWTPESLAERFGDLEVGISDGRDADPDYDARHRVHARTISLRRLVERLRAAGESNDFYMVANDRNLAQTRLGELLDEVALPEGMFAPERLRAASALWLGPAGTVTPLHHDTSNILFCQLYGRKRWRMIAPCELDLLDGARAMYAGVDPEAPDLSRYPWWPTVLVKDEILAPGEALFVPVGWWHHVRALDVSISLAMNGLTVPNRYDWFVPASA
jgi:hypothetical protein